MSILKTIPNTKPIIDLSGPKGNAFELLGLATSTGKQFGWSKDGINSICKDMMSSDYKHLVETFDKHFGEVIDLNLAGIEL